MKWTRLLAASLLIAGCQSEIDDKTAAEVAPAAAPTDAPAAAPAAAAGDAPAAAAGDAPAAAPEGSLALQPSSKIEWVGAKVTKDHPGGFKELSGYATVDGGALTSATVTIDVSSLYSDHPKLTKHLLNEDFFDVTQFATATFVITEVAAQDDGTSKVTGTLDLHGVKKSISFPATVTASDTGASVAAEFTLLRKDFGMAYPGRPDDLIRNEVLIKGTLSFGS